MGIRSRFRDYKNNFAKNNKHLLGIRDRIIWTYFHLNRGKGFWNQWLDILKTITFVFVGLASAKVLGADINLTGESSLVIGGVLTVSLILLFFITSQVMDFLKWQEAATEFDNKRNELFNEIRRFMNGKAKEPKEI